MTKRELIDQIIALNATASPAFLARFKQHDLEEYLRHLKWVADPASGPMARPVAQTPPAEMAQESAARDGAAEATAQGQPEPATEPAVEAAALEGQDIAPPPTATAQAEQVYASDVHAVEEAQPVGVAAQGTSPPFAQEESEEPQTFLF